MNQRKSRACTQRDHAHRSRFAGSLRIAATTPRRANLSCACFTPLFLSGLSCQAPLSRHEDVLMRKRRATHCSCRLFFLYAFEISDVEAVEGMSSHE